MSGAMLMALIAGALIFSAIVVASRSAPSDTTTDRARVRQRIVATMLGAAGLMLAAFAAALFGWDSGQ